jgi:predicted secreted protein
MVAAMTDTLGRIKGSVADARAGKLMFLSHCLLNQNACVQGIASQPAAIRAVVDAALDHETGIVQMPCPEMTYYGSQRWGQVKAQYSTPLFRRHCQVIAQQIIDLIEDYQSTGHHIVGIVMRDGSPTCGLQRACVAADDRQIWGGMVWQTPRQRFATTRGVFCEELLAEAERRGHADLQMFALPEVPEAGDFDAALVQIRNAAATTPRRPQPPAPPPEAVPPIAE